MPIKNISKWIALSSVVVAAATGLLLWATWPHSGKMQVLDVGALPQEAQSVAPLAAIVTATGTLAATAESRQQQTKAVSEELSIDEQVVAAFSCARVQRGLSPFKRDLKLTDEARTILTRVRTEPEHSFGARMPDYTLTGQLLIDLAEAPATPCFIGGFDVTSVTELGRASRIGVATAPLSIYGRTLHLTIVVGK